AGAGAGGDWGCLQLRATHHDTKISNALLHRESGRGLCVVDLDTVMPGYFISDIGDMFRTYLSPAGEEEGDLGKVMVRLGHFAAVVRGYLRHMRGVLSAPELRQVVFAGQFALFMQAVRFLGDYLSGDTYFKIAQPGQNLRRAENQLRLLAEYVALEPQLQQIVDRVVQEAA
ncbi:mucin-desulfating sulfatase, partial [Ochromonadaceae sp. CCMP2298]